MDLIDFSAFDDPAPNSTAAAAAPAPADAAPVAAGGGASTGDSSKGGNDDPFGMDFFDVTSPAKPAGAPAAIAPAANNNDPNGVAPAAAPLDFNLFDSLDQPRAQPAAVSDAGTTAASTQQGKAETGSSGESSDVDFGSSDSDSDGSSEHSHDALAQRLAAGEDGEESLRRELKWFWENDAGKQPRWVQYDGAAAGELSQALSERRSTFTFATGFLAGKYRINLDKMTQEKLATGFERPIRHEQVEKGAAAATASATGAKQWFWMGDDKAWLPYDAGMTRDLSEAHTRGDPEYSFKTGPLAGKYKVDFSSMEQVSLATGFARPVRVEVAAAGGTFSAADIAPPTTSAGAARVPKLGKTDASSSDEEDEGGRPFDARLSRSKSLVGHENRERDSQLAASPFFDPLELSLMDTSSTDTGELPAVQKLLDAGKSRDEVSQAVSVVSAYYRRQVLARAVERLAFMNSQRKQVALELLSTEETYVNDLQQIVDTFVVPCGAKNLLKGPDTKILFGNVMQLASLHAQLLAALSRRLTKDQWKPRQEISDVFLSTIATDEWSDAYVEYLDTFEPTTLERVMAKHKKFAKHVKKQVESSEKITRESQTPQRGVAWLQSLQMKPVQRLPRYVLLLQEIVKATPSSHEDFAGLKEALEKVRKVSNKVNKGESTSKPKGTRLEHDLVWRTVHKPQYCGKCSDAIWGIGRGCLRCTVCGEKFHKSCVLEAVRGSGGTGENKNALSHCEGHPIRQSRDGGEGKSRRRRRRHKGDPGKEGKEDGKKRRRRRVHRRGTDGNKNADGDKNADGAKNASENAVEDGANNLDVPAASHASDGSDISGVSDDGSGSDPESRRRGFFGSSSSEDSWSSDEESRQEKQRKNMLRRITITDEPTDSSVDVSADLVTASSFLRAPTPATGQGSSTESSIEITPALDSSPIPAKSSAAEQPAAWASFDDAGFDAPFNPAGAAMSPAPKAVPQEQVTSIIVLPRAQRTDIAKSAMVKCFAALEKGAFAESEREARSALNVLNEHLSAEEAQADHNRELSVCREYISAVVLLQANSAQPGTAFTSRCAECTLQPNHRLVTVRMAVKTAMGEGNFATAARFLEMLLPLKLQDAPAQQQMLAKCVENGRKDTPAFSDYECYECGTGDQSQGLRNCGNCNAPLLLDVAKRRVLQRADASSAKRCAVCQAVTTDSSCAVCGRADSLRDLA